MSRRWIGICGESGCCLEVNHAGLCKFNAVEEQDYEVEAIQKQRKKRNGTVEYLVKWLNWPEEDSTWETEETLADAVEALDSWRGRGSASRKEAGSGPSPAACGSAVTWACVQDLAHRRWCSMRRRLVSGCGTTRRHR